MAWAANGLTYSETEQPLAVDPGYQRFIQLSPGLTPETREFLKLVHACDPLEDLLALRCPHLALFGGAEELVAVEASSAVFAATACRRTGSTRLTLEVFPGADHRLQVGGDFAPGYFDALTRWLSAAVDGR
jgi:uncharacterized protein